MFVCEPCHSKPGWCDNGFIEGLMRSRGKCESCGNVANCLDCHGYKNKPLTREQERIIAGLPPKDVVEEVGAIMRDMHERQDDSVRGAYQFIDKTWKQFQEGEKVTVRFLDQPEDYVTCGAFLSMMHPVRVKTRATECNTLIPVKDLPCACPSCGQWKSA